MAHLQPCFIKMQKSCIYIVAEGKLYAPVKSLRGGEKFQISIEAFI